jgi:hypothetical protein
MPISKLIQRLSVAGPNAGKEGGSIIGGLGNLFE